MDTLEVGEPVTVAAVTVGPSVAVSPVLVGEPVTVVLELLTDEYVGVDPILLFENALT